MFTVGIPVRNEENNIKGVIDDVFSQSIQPKELIVCINGSKDKTKEILEGLQSNHSNIKLFESKPGKANAWNKIVDESSNHLMIFCDGDIRLGNNNSFKKLLDHLIEKKLTMLGGSIIQLPSNREKPYKLKIPSGQLYALDLKRLGLSKIPEDIINEDLFLALNAFPNLDVTQDSFFYSNKPNLHDISCTQLRILKGIKQIIDLGMIDKLLELLIARKYPINKIKIILLLIKFIRVNKNDNLWKEPLSTKKEIHLN